MCCRSHRTDRGAGPRPAFSTRGGRVRRCGAPRVSAWSRAPVIATAILLPVIACTLPRRVASPSAGATVQTQLSKEELGELLAQFEDVFEASLRDAADRIVTLEPDRRTRRLVLLLQARLLPMMSDAIDQDDALHALLDAWILAQRVQRYFTVGDGQAMFGTGQPIAVAAAQRPLEDIEGIAARILIPAAQHRARQAVDDLAERYPLRGEFSGTTVRTAVQKAERDPDVLTAILTAPIAPFRAFEGIDRGAAAIQGFTAVAARMNDTVQSLPESARLQAQLLLLEIEDLESLQSGLASIQQVAESSARISALAEGLPQELRRELSLAAEDLESRQAAFQRTLQEAQQTAARVNEALGRVETAASAVERTAQHTTASGDAWTQTFRALTEMVDSFRRPAAEVPTGTSTHPAPGPTSARSPADGDWPASAQPGPAESPTNGGFDIDKYTAAAQAFDQAALRLEGLTREVRGLAGSQELSTSLGDVENRARGVVESSRTSARDVIDHLAWRAAQLIVLFFVALFGYRLFVRMLGARATPSTAITK